MFDLRVRFRNLLLLNVVCTTVILFSGCGGNSHTGPDDTGHNSISGKIWFDIDADATHQADETQGIANVTVRLFTPEGYTYTTVSAGGGAGTFQFTGLNGGNYELEMDVGTAPPILNATTPTHINLNMGTESLDPGIHFSRRSSGLIRKSALIQQTHRIFHRSVSIRGGDSTELEAEFGLGFAPRGMIPMRFMTFGDSISRGKQSSDGKGYRTFLQPKIRNFFGIGEIVNGAEDGTMASEGINWLNAYIDQNRPAYVLIMYGILDCVNPVTWDDFLDMHVADTLFSMVNMVRSAGSMPILSTISPVNPVGRLAAAKSRIDYVNAILRQEAPGRNILLADVNAAMESQDNLPSYFADWGHPNDAGYRIIAQEWYDTIIHGSGYQQESACYGNVHRLQFRKTGIKKPSGN